MAFRQITTLPKLIVEQERVLSEKLGWEVEKKRRILESLSQKEIISTEPISLQSRRISFDIGTKGELLTDEAKLYDILKNWDYST